MGFWDKLDALRTEGETDQQFAIRLGIAGGTMSEWRKAARKGKLIGCSPQLLARICENADKLPSYFFLDD